MEEILILLREYLSIKSSAIEIQLIINSFDEDIHAEQSSLFEYFYDFKSIYKENISLMLKNAGVPDEKKERIINALSVLKETFDKYDVNNLDDLSLKISKLWKNSKMYSEELIKNTLLIEDIGWSNLPKSNISLLNIYKDIVEYDMILDPNIPIGTSSERLYTMLPADSSCYKYNLKVISNPMIDWSIYRNGCNPLEHYCALYNRSKNDIERKYYHDLIITAILSSCSLFNNKFAWHTPANKTEKMINYYLLVEKNEMNKRKHSINDSSFINEIHELLLTDELFNHQLKLYNEKNEKAEEVIKELKLSRESMQHKVR